jgi:hypothetical protein
LSWDEYRTAAEFLIFDQFLGNLSLQAAKSMVSIDMRNVLRRYLLRGLNYSSDDNEDDHHDAEDRQIVYLTSCLTDVNQLQATDPKDKVYGLYAVYTSLGIPIPAVEYRKPLANVYEDAALAMISWSASLKVLRDACSVRRDPTLPSWVPDWNDAEIRMFMPDSIATNLSRVADTNLKALSQASGKLRVRGKVVGEIVELKSKFPTRSDSCDLPILSNATLRAVDDLEFLRLFIDKVRFFRQLLRCLQTKRHLRLEDEPTDIFYEILTLGSGPPNDDILDTLIDILSYPDGRCDQTFGQLLARDWRVADKNNAASWTPELMDCTTIAASLVSNSIRREGTILTSHYAILDLFKDVAEHLADQALVLVKMELAEHPVLGTTFLSATAGDLVLLLEGGDWPVVLRPKGTEWLFIGPAYVIGIMYSEAWPVDKTVDGLEDFVVV